MKMEKIDFRAEGKQLAWDYLLVTLGALLTAFAFAAFFLPHDIAPGGVTGIATVLSSVTGAERRPAQLFDQPAALCDRLAARGSAVCGALVHLDDTALTVHRRDAGFRSGGQHDAGGDFWRRDDGRGAGPCGARGCDDGRHGHGRHGSFTSTGTCLPCRWCSLPSTASSSSSRR